MQTQNKEPARWVFVPEFGLRTWHNLRVGADAASEAPTLNFDHYADDILRESMQNSVRTQVHRMVLPFSGEPELGPEGLPRLVLTMFAKERRQTLAMLMRDGCFGYPLSFVGKLYLLAKRGSPTNTGDFRRLTEILRT